MIKYAENKIFIKKMLINFNHNSKSNITRNFTFKKLLTTFRTKYRTKNI